MGPSWLVGRSHGYLLGHAADTSGRDERGGCHVGIFSGLLKPSIAKRLWNAVRGRSSTSG